MDFSKIISGLTFLAMAVILTCCSTGKAEKLEVVSLKMEKSFDLLNDSIFLADVTDIVGTGDNIFLADHTINSIFRINEDFKLINEIGSAGNGPSEFNFLTKIAIKNDTVYAFDEGHQRILKFTLAGQLLKSIPVPGTHSGLHEFAVDNQNHVYVTSPQEAPILKLNELGKVEGKLGVFYEHNGRQKFLRNFRNILFTNNNRLVSVSVSEPLIELISLSGKIISRLDLNNTKNLSRRLNFINKEYNKGAKSLYHLFQDVCINNDNLFTLYIENLKDGNIICNKVLKIKIEEDKLTAVKVFELDKNTPWYSSIYVNDSGIWAFAIKSASLQKFLKTR